MSFSIAPTVAIVSTRVLAAHRPAAARPGRDADGRAGHAAADPHRRRHRLRSHVLPSLILIGIGFGLTIAPSFATATHGVPARDSGVASAMVSTSQQIGGSIGTALLSTLAASAVTPSPATPPRSGARRPPRRGRAHVRRLLRSDARPATLHAEGGETSHLGMMCKGGPSWDALSTMTRQFTLPVVKEIRPGR